jgi:hypothetical protein
VAAGKEISVIINDSKAPGKKISDLSLEAVSI